MKHNTAYFVAYPKRIMDLAKLHAIEKETPYEVAACVELSTLEYENFLADMTVERPFFAKNAKLCAEGPVKKCILVKRRDRTDGVLIIPSNPAHGREMCVKTAAYVDAAVGYQPGGLIDLLFLEEERERERGV